MGKATKFAIGAMLAAGIGYITGILTAPKSGKQTRADVATTAVRARKQAERQLRQATTELEALLKTGYQHAAAVGSHGKVGLKKALDQAAIVRTRAQDALQSSRRGARSDADIQQVTTETKQALDQVKDHLAKHDTKSD